MLKENINAEGGSVRKFLARSRRRCVGLP